MTETNSSIERQGPPPIGEVWPDQGGIYAGIVRGDPGQPDYHLVIYGVDRGDHGWDAAMQWATSIAIDGFHDFTLPKRKEQAVLFGNVPELFQKTWYWSCEQDESYASYAWFQSFDGCTQHDGRKNAELRARAVRRLII